MSDLRARLDKTLWGHRITERCGNGIVYCKCAPHHSIQGEWAHTCHQIHVLLSLDGIAVVERADLNQLLAVAQLYVDAFSEDEMMTLPEKLRLQEIERILAAADAAEGSNRTEALAHRTVTNPFTGATEPYFRGEKK